MEAFCGHRADVVTLTRLVLGDLAEAPGGLPEVAGKVW